MRHTLLRKDTTGLLLLLGAALASSASQGDVIYQQDFENWNTTNPLWSSSNYTSLGGTYTTLLGRFGAETVSLNVLATQGNTGGNSGGDPGSNPFNITTQQFSNSNRAESYPESSGGGGQGGSTGGNTNFGVPTRNLGDAISNGNNPGPPMFGPGTYALHFDLMLFDSWDGNYAPHGPDKFAVEINGQSVFEEALYSSAYGSGLNFRPPDEIPALNAFNSAWADSIYRDITVYVELTEATDHLDIDFMGLTTQSINDESWGIDNILIESLTGARSASVPEVPTPGALIILSSSLGMLTRRKR